jgi:dephospho-CoA kinase
MLVLGLTGNIASGKTEVARLFAELGATVIDADQLAREAVQVGSPALAAIVERWGRRVLQPDGSLDRAMLRSIVFANDDARKHLNAIVHHPEVKRLRDRAIAEARSRGDDVVIAVIPLLYEVGLESEFDQIILVDAPEAVRLERLVDRRALDASEARRIMAAQIPANVKRGKADFVIENDADLPALRRQVERIWTELQRQRVE